MLVIKNQTVENGTRWGQTLLLLPVVVLPIQQLVVALERLEFVGTSTGNVGGSGGGGAYNNRASGAGTAGPPRQGYDGGVNTYVASG